MMRHVDLFSGLAGFALAARANGIRTVQFCEIDPRCREFLSKAWPGVPIHDDIRTFHWPRRVADTEPDGRQPEPSQESGGVCGNAQGKTPSQPKSGNHSGRIETGKAGEHGIFLLTAGVPCQPASRAGKQRGAADDRWLWPEAVRILGEVKPTWALFENPPGIGDVGLAGVLADVEAHGYEVRVFGIPACAVGAPHRRERYWIVAKSNGDRRGAWDSAPEAAGHRRSAESEACTGDVAHAARRGTDAAQQPGRGDEHGGATGDVGDAESSGGGAGLGEGNAEQNRHGFAGPGAWADFVWLPCADGKVRRAPDDSQRMAHGLPMELFAELAEEVEAQIEAGGDHYTPHRTLLGALGNSVVPQVAAEIIAAIVEA